LTYLHFNSVTVYCKHCSWKCDFIYTQVS